MSISNNNLGGLYGLGITVLRNNPVFATPKAWVWLKAQDPTASKGGEFNVADKVIELQLSTNGALANSFLLANNALVVCLASEFQTLNFGGRWVFPLQDA